MTCFFIWVVILSLCVFLLWKGSGLKTDPHQLRNLQTGPLFDTSCVERWTVCCGRLLFMTHKQGGGLVLLPFSQQRNNDNKETTAASRVPPVQHVTEHVREPLSSQLAAVSILLAA